MDIIGGSHGQQDVELDKTSEIDDYVGYNDELVYDCGIENVDVQQTVENVDVQQTVENSAGCEVVDEDVIVDDVVNGETTIITDPDNPIIKVGSLFEDVYTFRQALRHFAILNQFEVKTVKTDKTRFIGECKYPNCHWRIHASRLQDNRTFMVKVIRSEHTCPSISMMEGKMASKSWVSNRIADWLKKNPSIGANDVRKKLQDEFHVKISYDKAWTGRKQALEQIHGSWEDNFQMLYAFKCEMEKRCPGSVVEIDCKRVGGKAFFDRVFIALKPCIDGFIKGCRPFLGVDSTHLTGKYKGQLAAASSIDGHNWLFPVAYGVFDTETKDNWEWFMTQLRNAIGARRGLTICSDACKGLSHAIAKVFPEAEHREYMRHLAENFSKKFHGEIFSSNLWLAARAYTPEKCQYYLNIIKNAAPHALNYLEQHHDHLWCRSQFCTLSKCDYVTNNISESFNNWMKEFKDLQIVDLLEKIRERIMMKFDRRRAIGRKFQGLILPSVMKGLNDKSRATRKMQISRSADHRGEVSGIDLHGKIWKHAVELDKQVCTCMEWQHTGQPCIHAIAFICSIRGAQLENYVNEYFSNATFRDAYDGEIAPMPDKSQWSNTHAVEKIYPPKLKRPAGRPRKQRIKGCLELTKRRVRCKRCQALGHQEKTCKEPIPHELDAVAR